MNKAIENYIKNYDMTDKDIHYKYHHSYRVMEKAQMLAKNLSEEDQKLATVIGLYHDIGRFEQDKLYDSYRDSKKFDHGDYGVDVLFNQGLIKEIPIEEKHYTVIEKAIKNHNKYKIEDNLTEQELFHTKLIRDADKLDIIYALAENIFNKKELDYEKTEEIREEIKEQFFNKQTIDYSKLKKGVNTNEKLVGLLALIFDLNFKESFEYINKNDLLEKINNHLSNKNHYKEYFDYLKDYIKEALKC